MVKPYPYPFFFSDTDTDRILDGYGYGYGSDRIFIKKYIKILLKSIKVHNIYLIIMVNNINFFIIYIKLYDIYLLFGYG